MKPIARK